VEVFFAHSKSVTVETLDMQAAALRKWPWHEMGVEGTDVNVTMGRDSYMDFVKDKGLRGSPSNVVYPAWCKFAGEFYDVYVTAETILGKATADILRAALARGVLVFAWLADSSVARVTEIRDRKTDEWKSGWEAVTAS